MNLISDRERIRARGQIARAVAARGEDDVRTYRLNAHYKQALDRLEPHVVMVYRAAIVRGHDERGADNMVATYLGGTLSLLRAEIEEAAAQFAFAKALASSHPAPTLVLC